MRWLGGWHRTWTPGEEGWLVRPAGGAAGRRASVAANHDQGATTTYLPTQPRQPSRWP